MPKRSAKSDSESDYQPKPPRSSPRKKPKTPGTPKAQRTADRISPDVFASPRASGSRVPQTPEKRQKTRNFDEAQTSSPSKATLEAENILAQYSPGTKRIVKKSDLKKLKATQEERRQEALLRVEKQKEASEERRKEIFSRLEGLGYSSSIIEKDKYDDCAARSKWWQLAEEPEELTETAWEKIRPDLCIILERRKEAIGSGRAQLTPSASSSPTRPKQNPARLPKPEASIRPDPAQITNSTTLN